MDSFLDNPPLPCCEVTVVAKAGEGTAEHLHCLVPILNIDPSRKVSIQCSLLIPISNPLSEYSIFVAYVHVTTLATRYPMTIAQWV